MPRFFFIARNKDGKKISGVEDAPSQEEAVSRLQAKELIVISMYPESQHASAGSGQEVVAKVKFRPKHRRVSGEDLVLFCRQISTLLGAGVTILKSLDIIKKQVASQKLYDVIADLQKNMEAGLSFHEAMARHAKVFSELWVNLVESGEASGNLAIVLNRLAGYLERNAAFKRKIISALMYPAILMTAGIGALLFLTIKIVPTFAELFKGFNITLPLITRILVLSSELIRKYLLIALGGAVFVFFALRKYTATRQGKRNLEKFLFNLPVFGEFYRVMVIERFTAEMSTLVESGVPILYSLEIAEHSVDTVVLGEIIRNIKEDVRQGKSLNEPLEKSGFFDPMTVQMVAIGEEIGELSGMFKRLNAYYQEFVDTFLTRFTSLFEPLMLVFIGAIVGVMVLGMFLPIFQITQIK